jgi:hypothetical protein
MATINVKGYGGAERQGRRVRSLNHTSRPGFVHLKCNLPPLDHTVLLGPNGWKLSDVAGGWESTQRPMAVGMTTWNGVPPLEGDLHILWDTIQGVERQVQELINVARGTANATPGVIYVDGLANMPTDRWIIGSLSFGDLVIRARNMVRIRQDITLHLIEYQPPVYETLRANALAKPRPKTVIYKVKKNDTPAKIAKARRCKWQDIQKLNKKGVVKTANQKLKVGIQIMVPVVAAPPKKTVKK